MPNSPDPRIEIGETLGNARAKLGFLLSDAESKQVLIPDESKKMVQLLSDLYAMEQELISRARRDEAAKKNPKPIL